LIGSKGSLHFEDAMSSKPLTYFKKNQNGSPIVLDQSKGEFIEYEQSLPLTNELEYFVDYVNGAPIEKANLNSGMDVIKILEMATHSLNKKSLPISPFTGEN
jgi:predicted dehydrogenase